MKQASMDIQIMLPGTAVFSRENLKKSLNNKDFSGKALQKLGHRSMLWSHLQNRRERQVTPPNCTEKGYTTFTCACGHSYQGDYVDALGHSYQTTVVQPTYTHKGYTDYVCHCGSTDRKNFKDPLGLPEPVVKVSVDQN